MRSTHTQLAEKPLKAPAPATVTASEGSSPSASTSKGAGGNSKARDKPAPSVTASPPLPPLKIINHSHLPPAPPPHTRRAPVANSDSDVEIVSEKPASPPPAPKKTKPEAKPFRFTRPKLTKPMAEIDKTKPMSRAASSQEQVSFFGGEASWASSPAGSLPKLRASLSSQPRAAGSLTAFTRTPEEVKNRPRAAGNSVPEAVAGVQKRRPNARVGRVDPLKKLKSSTSTFYDTPPSTISKERRMREADDCFF